jgi:hypothetical protein
MKFRTWIFCGLSACFLPKFAAATLGEPLASVQKDAGSLKAAQKASSSGEAYTMSEMYADGNTIKQYSNPEGIVFAVSWTGISKPDLQVLFGSYFTEYSNASNELPKKMGAKSISFKTSKMVVRRAGRMRDQRGLAYVPSLVPAGVKVEDLP